MIGRLKDLTFGLHGEQIISLTVQADFRGRYDELKDTDVEIDIKKFRNRRSLDANAYAWVLIDKIAAAMSIEKIEVYREAIRSIGGVSEHYSGLDAAIDKLAEQWERKGLGWQAEKYPSKLPGCTNVILYYGSSTYDSKQMSLLIDKLVQDAKQLDIPTDTPEQIARYKEEWH